MADERWLVVGLGNPEGEYGGTRHNVGADVVRAYATREAVELSRNKRARCEVAEVRRGDGRVVLAVPEGYMNNSGGPTQQAANWYSVPPDRIIVVHDEVDLPVAALRLKFGGGTAGHNGLKDVERALGTSDFYRVRVGVDRPPGRMATKDHVLRRFAPAEREEVDVTIQEALDAIDLLMDEGLEPAQNRYH
ncbi:MAG: aminoacyl-tRNA hydrolase [Nitriliruptorales bacterium]|nr:aminoacyl-tRNA hydrolase [Nitriliruptorales bacterium]